MYHHKKVLLVVAPLVVLFILFEKCVHAPTKADPRGSIYAGASSCRQCHATVYDNYMRTAHAAATSFADSNTIRGNFSGSKGYRFEDNTETIMEKRDSGYYQVLYAAGKEKAAYRFDILFGRVNAQTGVYWHKDQLYQLPVSFYTSSNSWATSPGFPTATPHFARLINTDCFDCHSSNISIKNTSVNSDPTYDKSLMIPGIDCERCHGPAAAHVDFHARNPGATVAEKMVRYATLNNQQRLDACGICHSGNDKMKIQSRFEFQMGDSLGYFFMPFGGGDGTADVHGNQQSLLMQSKCFTVSKMTCGTCHNPHEDTGRNHVLYSQKCMTCHQPGSDDFCGKYKDIGEPLKRNCIDCHMPRQASKAISYQLQNNSLASPYLLRTHNIGVYADTALLRNY